MILWLSEYAVDVKWTGEMKLSHKRAETLSLLALVLHLVFFLLTLWIAAASRALAVAVEGSADEGLGRQSHPD